MNNFTSTLVKIENLFSSQYDYYVIPEYQRAYSWDSIGKNDSNNQINVMWDDLMEFYHSESSQYFMGSMVFVQDPNIGKNEYEVIDGQQRLTSLILLFSALRETILSLRKLSKENKSTLENSSAETLTRLENELGRILVPRSSKRMKILNNLGFNYDEVLSFILSIDKKGITNENELIEKAEFEQKNIVRRYFRNHTYFISKIKEVFVKDVDSQKELELTISKLDRFFERIQSDVYVAKTVADSFDMAYSVFEVLNNRGLPLSNEDLLKNYIVSQFHLINHEQPIKKWYELEKNNINDEFLSRWIVSIKGSKQEKTAFNEFKLLYGKLFDDNINLIYDRISTDLDYYNLVSLLSVDDIRIKNKIKFILSAGNSKYSVSLLIALFRHFQYDGGTNAKIVDFLSLYECYILGILNEKSSKRFSPSPVYKAIVQLNKNNYEDAKKIFEEQTEKEIDNIIDFINNKIYDTYLQKLLFAKYIWSLEVTSDSDSFHEFIYDSNFIIDSLLNASDNMHEYSNKLSSFYLISRALNNKTKNQSYQQKIEKFKSEKTFNADILKLPNKVDEDALFDRQFLILNTILYDLGIKRPKNFIEEIIEEDFLNKSNRHIITRFPPEPNGYLHIGHAKSICLNFGLALKYNGKTNLRFDDTNPTKEDIEYVDSIREDVKWLIEGMPMTWSEERYASDYFQTIYELTVKLIQKGLAYVDHSTAEEMATLKGTPTQAGKNSPYRDRSIEENLDLFEQMKSGVLPDGTCVLRAKIDMDSPNMLLRDPVIYRIKHAHHHQTGDKWCIYPMYDYAHPISDAIENITHSVCTLEFEVHRPFYDWTIKNLELFPSRQIEFARLNLTYTIMSKRKLLQLVTEGVVNGWDDPRMPTISGLRRRGYTPTSLREFANRIGIAKRDNMIDVGLLEFCVREDLNKTAQRVMAVLNPLKVVLMNYPDRLVEFVEIENNPEDPDSGKREVPFGRELWIEREDFMEDPPKKYFRLAPNGYFRLKGAYIIKHLETIKDEEGNITELHCEYVTTSKSGSDESGIKVKGVGHWVNIETAVTAECRIYDRLFSVENPDGDKEKSFLEYINPNSLTVLETIFVEPSVKDLAVNDRVQFLRHGYFAVDKDSTEDKLVFNRTVTLKDSWKA